MLMKVIFSCISVCGVVVMHAQFLGRELVIVQPQVTLHHYATYKINDSLSFTPAINWLALDQEDQNNFTQTDVFPDNDLRNKKCIIGNVQENNTEKNVFKKLAQMFVAPKRFLKMIEGNENAAQFDIQDCMLPANNIKGPLFDGIQKLSDNEYAYIKAFNDTVNANSTVYVNNDVFSFNKEIIISLALQNRGHAPYQETSYPRSAFSLIQFTRAKLLLSSRPKDATELIKWIQDCGNSNAKLELWIQACQNAEKQPAQKDLLRIIDDKKNINIKVPTPLVKIAWMPGHNLLALGHDNKIYTISCKPDERKAHISEQKFGTMLFKFMAVDPLRPYRFIALTTQGKLIFGDFSQKTVTIKDQKFTLRSPLKYHVLNIDLQPDAIKNLWFYHDKIAICEADHEDYYLKIFDIHDYVGIAKLKDVKLSHANTCIDEVISKTITGDQE